MGIVPEGNRFYGNSFAENGRNPHGEIKKLGLMNTDIFWDGSGWDNSFEQSGVRTFPALLPTDGWPDLLRRSYARIYGFVRDRLM